MEMATDNDDWPTTQRFSRRLGEAVHDVPYACAIERPALGLAVGLAHYMGHLSRLMWGRERGLSRTTLRRSSLTSSPAKRSPSQEDGARSLLSWLG
jgi:hypothetical protein